MLTTADRAICTIDIHNVFKSVSTPYKVQYMFGTGI